MNCSPRIQAHWSDDVRTENRVGRQCDLPPAGDGDPVIYTVPRVDPVDDVRTLFPDESYEANLLQSHPVASSWVTNWAGPYHIRMTGGAYVMMKLIEHIDDYERSVRYRSMTPIQRGVSRD